MRRYTINSEDLILAFSFFFLIFSIIAQESERERDSLAIQRYIERNKELNEKDKDEMKRLKEIVDADT